ncbi:CPBP family intramembrane glutamic endopeptidase [Leptotrichia buccalis]|uniref:Abortive infection protein n=1 Tax=Leptotrichia buccalis (strain ATCC 14201 / DSM 1135 / JCM 12969 / NCTC 10249 / C-1013-b) TaxID=523794 RepID=C7N9T9_LEPBD|nr:type II CAAX endopeptidase family protein [Leptotrichia buccalis]ACV38920.1 Abortive infection protein [Leptotrichia buccalis C-1013-b]
MSFKDNTKKDSFLILFIIYILHLIFMIFVNNKISIIDSQIFKYVYMFRIHRWILSFPIIYYFVKTYKKYEYFKTNEKLNAKDFSVYFALAFWIGNFFSFLIVLMSSHKGRTPVVAIYEPLYTDIIMTVFVAPVLEEIVFRGVIMNNLKKYGIKTAIIINSIFFALSHYNTDMIIPAFFTGIIFSYVAYKYSIKYSILIHFFINAITKTSQVLAILRIDILLILIGLFSAFLIIFLLVFFIIRLLGGKYKEVLSVFKLSIEDRKNILDFMKNNLLYLLIIFMIVISNLVFNY